MNCYVYTCKYSGTAIISVDAECEAEAIEKIKNGEGDWVDGQDEELDYDTLVLDHRAL